MVHTKKKLGFRAWFYLRTGYSQYFAFVLAAVNTLTVTYFLAIENYPSLYAIFPTFGHYIVVIVLSGIPLLIWFGYLHYKRVPAFAQEAETVQISQPYTYKLTPGHAQHAQYPLYLSLTKMMLKMSRDEKFTKSEISELTELQKKIEGLIQGGSIGSPPKSISENL